MRNITFGNTMESDPERRGWLLGNFLNADSPLRTDDVEIKWAVLKKGENKTVAAANKLAKSISILVRGNVIINFPDDGRVVELKKEGDYAYWTNDVFHTTEILEDSVVITIRWPSIADDSYTK